MYKRQAKRVGGTNRRCADLGIIEAIMAVVVIATFFLAAVGVASSRIELLTTSLISTERQGIAERPLSFA